MKMYDTDQRMSVISPILEEYRILEEKILWFVEYLEHIAMANTRTAEIYFRCTQIPRNTCWQDVNIINIVDAIDKTRETCEKFTKTCEETLLVECNDLLQRVKQQITYLSQLEANFSNSIKRYSEELVICQESHETAWEKQDKDIWMTERSLKYALKQYLKKSDQWDSDLKKELLLVDKSLLEIGEAFVNCMNSSQFLQKNLHHILGNVHHQTIIDQQKYQKDHFFDFPEQADEKKTEEIQRNKFDDEFDKIINEMRINNSNIKKNVSIRKHGIFKVKKGYETKIALVIITETRFVHAFDIESMVSDRNLSANHMATIKKLNDLKKGGSFFTFKSEVIDKDEEEDLLDLRDFIFESLDVKKYCIKGFPFRIRNKLVRFEKNRKEITITEKKTPSIKDFLFSNHVKIKSFLDKDLFELFYALCTKLPEIIDESESRESPEIPKKEEMEDSVPQEEEDNPWRTVNNKT